MIHQGSCLDILPTLEAGSVHTCITSPPYFGLRKYGDGPEIGAEPTPDEFVAALVAVFREVRRVLRDDGTLWLNLGDTYFSPTKGSGGSNPATSPKQAWKGSQNGQGFDPIRISAGDLPIKSKDLVGIPWRVAFALQADGWYLRQDIIWHKPNPMPESVRDRCTKAHEYIFLLSKGPRYHFDAEAIKEPAVRAGCAPSGNKSVDASRHDANLDVGKPVAEFRNKRSVWTVATQPYSGAHFATFPSKLIEPCILAGAPVGGLVLDPFAGAGTTWLAAHDLGRRFVGCELYAKNVTLAENRIAEHISKTAAKPKARREKAAPVAVEDQMDMFA